MIVRRQLGFGCAAVVLLVCTLWGGEGKESAAEGPRGVTTTPTTAPADMSAGEFDKFMAAVRARIEAARQEPAELEDLLWQRIRSHGDLGDAAIEATVSAWSGYEGIASLAKVPARPVYTQTKRLIGELLLVVQERPRMAAWLLGRRAHLLESEGDRVAARKDFEAAVAVIAPLRLEVDRLWLESLVGAGEAALMTLDNRGAGDNKGAEAAFLQALSYEWYKVADPDGVPSLRDLYLRAGRGLISARRHNLALLKEIRFVPSTLDELGPPLEAAIREAEQEQPKP